MPRLLIILLIICLLLFGCKGKKEIIKKSDLSGYWEQQGEGEIIEINDSLVIAYYSSSFNCFPNWKVSRDYFNTKTPTIRIINHETFTNKEGYTIHTYIKLKEKPILCKELTEEQKNSNTYNFETLWATFNEQYAFFKERNINWYALKAKYQARFTNDTKPFEFYLLLEKMVLELKDAHSDFEVPEEFEEQWQLLHKKKDTADYKALAQNGVLKKYVRSGKTYIDDTVKWGLVSDQLAYIQLNNMYNFSENDSENPEDLVNSTHKIAASVVNDIRNTKACIIDLRFNTGGYDWLGLAFMSHFIDREYDVFTKERRYTNSFSGKQTIDIKPSKNPYTGTVYILTSPYTVSAAETAVIASMNFDNFKTIGANTCGALSDQLYKKLPNGWTYWLSNEVYESMDGKVYEVTGVPPDYKIDYPKEDSELFKSILLELQSKDSAIEKVIELELD